ncbi:alpha-amylase [Flavobacterium sp. RHBU_3]|uniref:alpha-amylase n=1 Tax=Flavobacterium sp. RHBU_3 TaxID=3391184 RepID=UPI0039849D3B
MKKYLIIFTAAILLYGCSTEMDAVKETTTIAPQEGAQPSNSTARSAGGTVMMQAFYWDCPSGGTWWNTIAAKVADWHNAGVDAIWLPPATKGASGGYSMGYDPFDYFDFGDYNQMGSTETRFGSKSELQNLITTAHNNDLYVIADIVINHNGGGSSEYNPYTGGNTYTNFNPASGMFSRTLLDFHPNNEHASDAGTFGSYPDLCHDKTYVQGWLYNNSNSVAKYYKNTMGFDGWRFDYVAGYAPSVCKNFRDAVGGFAVGELWESAANLDTWTVAADMRAFDFPCYFAMRDALAANDLTKLNADMLFKRKPYNAVTFVSNHDTNEIYNGKMLAYAYILTHEGYPCIFYRDYEEWLDKNKLNNLIWIHNNKASGSTTYLYADNDEYVAKRNGSPGLVVYINNSDSWQQRWVETNWASTVIKDYTGNSTWEPTTQSGKWVQIQAPPHGYTIWSVK